ncbi:MAG: hypothetical protein JO329_04065 [Planctomycetaceae bacterium]|nr:hypothetical protein [Planctomycetaceae bacterium]
MLEPLGEVAGQEQLEHPVEVAIVELADDGATAAAVDPSIRSDSPRGGLTDHDGIGSETSG